MTRRLGWGQLLLLLAALAPGCGRRSSEPQPPARPSPAPGSRQDAVLHEPVTVATKGEVTTYSGARWKLTLPTRAGWRQDLEASSTLALVRPASGTQLRLRIRAFGVRPRMPVRTFLAAHAMWIAEEDRARLEHEWDPELGLWLGYAISGQQETYYAFRIEGDRAYVLEETAAEGAVDAAAAREFRGALAEFECRPQ